MYDKGRYFEAAGNKEQAIACYRRLMTQPEWKQSSYASQAHQALERLGVQQTGGGVVSEVH